MYSAPAFIPTPIGEIVEYVPTLNEVLICLGIWAVGLLMYTIFVRITVPVLNGDLAFDTVYHTDPETTPAVRNASGSERSALS